MTVMPLTILTTALTLLTCLLTPRGAADCVVTGPPPWDMAPYIHVSGMYWSSIDGIWNIVGSWNGHPLYRHQHWNLFMWKGGTCEDELKGLAGTNLVWWMGTDPNYNPWVFGQLLFWDSYGDLDIIQAFEKGRWYYSPYGTCSGVFGNTVTNPRSETATCYWVTTDAAISQPVQSEPVDWMPPTMATNINATNSFSNAANLSNSVFGEFWFMMTSATAVMVFAASVILVIFKRKKRMQRDCDSRTRADQHVPEVSTTEIVMDTEMSKVEDTPNLVHIADDTKERTISTESRIAAVEEQEVVFTE